MNERSENAQVSTDVRYFKRVEPLELHGFEICRRDIPSGGRLITIYEGDLTVEEAVQVRNWLNLALGNEL